MTGCFTILGKNLFSSIKNKDNTSDNDGKRKKKNNYVIISDDKNNIDFKKKVNRQ